MQAPSLRTPPLLLLLLLPLLLPPLLPPSPLPSLLRHASAPKGESVPRLRQYDRLSVFLLSFSRFRLQYCC
jgi:hypothetical protein